MGIMMRRRYPAVVTASLRFRFVSVMELFQIKDI
jgi:hypothetical protein